MKKQYLFQSLTAAFVLSLVSACTSDAQPAMSDQIFADMMKKYLATDEGQKTVGSTVEGYFRKRQAEAAQGEEKKAAAEMEEQFKNPIKIDVGNSPVTGPAGAKVTIIEFSDFQCPFCKRGHDTIKQVLAAYPNDVKVVFKHKPLPFHKDATPAAKASWAAGKQGKFWEYHDALFDNQDKLAAPNFFNETAQKLGLNVEKFKTDMASKEASDAIDADSKVADANDVQGTPNFFVNGVALRGAYPIDQFKKIIDRHLGK